MQDAKMHIEIKEKPDYFWKVTEWTACPAGCGGMQTRSVTCVKCAPHTATLWWHGTLLLDVARVCRCSDSCRLLAGA